MNKKGQALVEFIIILPIFIMLMLAAFDFVKIYTTKMDLENMMEEIILDENYKLSDDILLTQAKSDKNITYNLSKEIELTSPFVTLVTDNPYKVMIERSVYEK